MAPLLLSSEPPEPRRCSRMDAEPFGSRPDCRQIVTGIRFLYRSANVLGRFAHVSSHKDFAVLLADPSHRVGTKSGSLSIPFLIHPSKRFHPLKRKASFS